MNLIEAIVIAVVEGLTEFLPVSSTGHMIITQALLGIESTPFVKAFTVIIQFGAILSVVVLYWQRFFHLNRIQIFDSQTVQGMNIAKRLITYTKRFLFKFDFYWKLLIALVPAGIMGLLFGDQIDALLENVFVVALMLVLGGIVMLFVDKWFSKTDDSQEITWKRALKIGFFQCIAMIPGVSRSMATIVGGMATKLNRKNAAEFSFFLAVPTMAAATGYTMYKMMKDPMNEIFLGNNLTMLIVGNIVAFIVALVAIKFFIDFLTKHGFKAFGYYRIVVGGLLLILLGTGIVQNII